MIALYFGYGLFILYCFLILAVSAMCWLGIGLSVLAFFNEDHNVDADWRPIAVTLCVVGLLGQWAILKTADIIIPLMWYSLPPLPPLFG